MFKQTIIRVRPNKTVKWHFENVTPENEAIELTLGAMHGAAGAVVGVDENFTSNHTVSANELTLTVVRTSSKREILDEIQVAYANPDHIANARTKYYADNGVTETYVTEEITA